MIEGAPPQILVEGFQHDARTALIIDQLVEARADRLCQEALIADLLVIGLRENIDGEEAEIEFGGWRRLGINQHGLRGRDDLDILQVLKKTGNGQLLVLLRTRHPAVFHVFRRQLRAIVEEQIVAQCDFEPRRGVVQPFARDDLARLQLLVG